MILDSIMKSYKNLIFLSLGIKTIKFEEFYMLAWWIAAGFLTAGFSMLRTNSGFLSIYTLILSLILIVLLIILGKISGKVSESAKNSGEGANK